MSDRAHRAPRPLAALMRAAAVLTLLSGVFAMHALTVGHRPIPDAPTPAVPVAAPHVEQIMDVAQQRAG